MRHNSKLFSAFLVASAMSLAACAGSDGWSESVPVIVTPPPPPPPVLPTGSDLDPSAFGAGFAAKYNADHNSDPTSPQVSDIIAIDPTADPINPPPDPG